MKRLLNFVWPIVLSQCHSAHPHFLNWHQIIIAGLGDEAKFMFDVLDIEKHKGDIADLCESMPVARLGLFGSSLTDRFNDSSDIDVLVVFDTGEEIDYFNEYFTLKEKLEDVFNRPVDLVIDKKFKNPYFQQVVDQTRRVIYER